MAKGILGPPIVQLTPGEVAESERRALMPPELGPDLQDALDAPFGPFVAGARQSTLGAAIYRSTQIGYQLFHPEEYDVPLNLTKSKSEYSPATDPFSFGQDNNPETIAQLLQNVEWKEHGYLLGTESYQEFLDRLQYVRLASPEVQQAAGPLGGLGYATGMAADMSSLIALGVVTEPLAIAGLGARAELAGQAAFRAYGAERAMPLAQAASEAVAAVSRTNLAFRYTALGIAEEGIYQAAKAGIDPTYDPSAGQVMLDLTVSGGVAGLLGGAAFGRTFIKSHVEDAAQQFRRNRTKDLPGGYTINWNGALTFKAPAAADDMLFAAGTGSMADEAAKVADDLHANWHRERGPKADFAIPGTPQPQPNAIRLYRGEGPITVSKADEAAGTFWTPEQKLAAAYGEQGSLRQIDFVPSNLLEASRWSDIKAKLQLPASATVPDVIQAAKNRGHDSIAFVGPQGKEYILLNKVPTEIRDAAGRIPAKPKMGQLVGLRSAIKAAVHELSLAGMPTDAATFRMVAETLVETDRTKVVAGAFNKRFWDAISSKVSPDVAQRIRPIKDRTFIPGIDKSLMDVARREDMVSSVWAAFRGGEHLEPGIEKSLIFQVLQEIRNRGGTVNRQVVGDVIDELRVISQNPPKRMNAKGKEVLDTYARRRQVYEVINKRAAGGKQIDIPESLVKKLAAKAPAVVPTGVAATLVGTKADYSDIPQVQRFFEYIPILGKYLNQAVSGLRSNNGAFREMVFMSFNARRSFDTAQPQTIFEYGTQFMHDMMFSFVRGYRNNYVRFALGNGVENVSSGDVNLVSAMKTAFGSKNRELRREFNKRVAKQLRTGLYDDAHDGVNAAAKEIREVFNRVHDMAHAVGLRGFTKSAVNNYMPRVWRWDRIRRLSTTAAGKKDLVALVKQAIDRNGRKVVIDGVEQTFTQDIDEAALAFTERLIAIANKTENAPTIAQEQELFDAISALEGPLKAKTPSKTPFGRARILMDEMASVRTTADHLGDGKTALSIADLTNDDLPMVFRRYITSVMGAINEKRLLNAINESYAARGILGPKTKNAAGETVQEPITVNSIEEAIAVARKIGGEIDPEHEAAFREVMAAIRYEPLHHGAANLGDKVLGVALPLGYLTTGGQFGLAAMGEMARIVGTLGLTKTLRQLPVLTEMLSNWKNMDKESQNFASLLDSWFSPSTDRLRRAFISSSGDPDQYASLPKRMLDGAANLMSDASLLAPTTSFTQQLTAATTMQHLWEVGKGFTKRLDDATVRSLGLEPAQYDTLVAYVTKNAKTKEGFFGSRIVGMDNIDAVEMDSLKAFVDRMVRTRIQDMPTRGDFHKSVFSFFGRLLTQFRSFNIKGIDNFLLQNATRVARGGGEKVASEIAATMVFAGMIQYSRNYADWRSYKASGDIERRKQAEKSLGVGGFVRGAVSGPSEFFLMTMGVDAFWTRAIDPDPIFAPYRYSGLKWYGFPAEAMLIRAGSVAADVYGATVGKGLGLGVERDVTQGTLHKFRLLLPAQNFPGVKQMFNITEQEIADEFNLPKIQS